MIQRCVGSSLLLAASALVGPISQADAEIVTFGGSVAVRTPPANISLHQWESATEARLWPERTITLTQPLGLDAINTGTVSQANQLVPGQVAAGTAIASYMLRSDALGTAQSTYSGFIVFDQPILGVMVEGATLNGSDALLSLPGVLYNTNNQRGLEFPPLVADPFTISVDRRRIDFMFTVGEWTDDLRIVTGVPAPGGLSAALLGLSMVGYRRRRGH